MQRDTPGTVQATVPLLVAWRVLARRIAEEADHCASPSSLPRPMWEHASTGDASGHPRVDWPYWQPGPRIAGDEVPPTARSASLAAEEHSCFAGGVAVRPGSHHRCQAARTTRNQQVAVEPYGAHAVRVTPDPAGSVPR